jgi:hypothetical protein
VASEIWAKTGASPSEVYGFQYLYDLAGNRLKARINGANTYYFYDRSLSMLNWRNIFLASVSFYPGFVGMRNASM